MMKIELACDGKIFEIELEQEGSRYRARLLPARQEGVSGSLESKEHESLGLGADWRNFESRELAGGARLLLGVADKPVRFTARQLAERGDYQVTLDSGVWHIRAGRPGARRAAEGIDDSEDSHEVRAQMPGLVVKVLVSAGTSVERGDSLLVIEAMKMANEIQADRSGRLAAIHCRPGKKVERGELLLVFEKG